MADLSDWLTKQQASELLSVSEKTIERYVKAKKLQTRTRREKGQRPVLVFDPTMVQKLIGERDQANADDDIIDISATSPAPVDKKNKSLAPSLPPQLAMLVAALETSRTVAIPIDRKLFLTPHEGALFSGLPESYLRRLISTGKLKAMKTGSGWRIQRIALELWAAEAMGQKEESS
jgi:excisionase family DNA binding protein